MMKPEADIEPFGKFVEAIDPWLEQTVLVGGWAHRLYRNDPRARHLEYVPLTTLDGDVALPAKLKIEESTVRERLIDAGFLEEFVGRPSSRDALSLWTGRRVLRGIPYTPRRKRIRPKR